MVTDIEKKLGLTLKVGMKIHAKGRRGEEDIYTVVELSYGGIIYSYECNGKETFDEGTVSQFFMLFLSSLDEINLDKIISIEE